MPPAERTSHKALGGVQEGKALDYFMAMGWRLMERNYRCAAGEVDLILKDPEKAVVFVEVKYRSRDDFGAAQSFVDSRKQDRLVKAALHFIKRNRLQGSDFRFDVAAVTPRGIEHIPNAFSAEGYTL